MDEVHARTAPAAAQFRACRDVYANPETVDFGPVAARELADNSSVLDLLTQSFTVRKRAGSFSITAVTSDLPFVTIRRSPEGKGSSEAFRIDVALMKGPGAGFSAAVAHSDEPSSRPRHFASTCRPVSPGRPRALLIQLGRAGV